MFTCCKKKLYPIAFYIASADYEIVRAEFKRCPHCNKAYYREQRKDYNGRITTTTIKTGLEAERLIKKAWVNRLSFLEKLKSGTKSNHNWFYGDFKKGTEKDHKGNLIELQIKRNFNGEEVENLGEAKVIYK